MVGPVDHALSPKLKIWYDGGCPLCIREIAVIQRLDRANRIDFIDLTQPDIACPLDKGLMLSRFHATTGDGETMSGAAAFAAMWREIPMLRPLGLVAQNKIILVLLEGAYLLFLRIRPLLQRLAR